MSFKIGNCLVLSINHSNQNQPLKYAMNDVNTVKDLGIFLDTNLLWDKHIRYITDTVSKLTDSIKRTVGQSAPVNVNVNVLKQLHSSIVMPQLT